MLNWLVYYLLLAGFTLPGCLLSPRPLVPRARSPFLVVAVGFVFRKPSSPWPPGPPLAPMLLSTLCSPSAPLQGALTSLGSGPVRPGAAIVGAPRSRPRTGR